MDDMKTRTFMRGKVKNAEAEELLALLKAEREMNNDSAEIPNTLKKRPLLPAIRHASRDEDSLYEENETASFPITTMNSRFLWKAFDWDETRGNKTWQERRNSDCSLKEKDFWFTEVTGKGLPPLKTKRGYSQRRPRCPEPPSTPCFDESSHGS